MVFSGISKCVEWSCFFSLFPLLFFKRSLRRILDEDYDHILESLDMDFTVRHYCAIQTCHMCAQARQCPTANDIT